MELPEELLLTICEHLQPARYEEAVLIDEYDATRRAAHRSAAAVRMVSRGFRGLMNRTARVVSANAYRSRDAFLAQTHRHAELFESNGRPWVTDEVLRSLHIVMPRLRAVDLSNFTIIHHYWGHYDGVDSAICHAVAAAPLTTLSLTIGYAMVGEHFVPLENNPTLRHLSLNFQGYSPPQLPECLPNLETMSIAVGPTSCFNWDSLPFCPSLKTLSIDDRCGDVLYAPSILGASTSVRNSKLHGAFWRDVRRLTD